MLSKKGINFQTLLISYQISKTKIQTPTYKANWT